MKIQLLFVALIVLSLSISLGAQGTEPQDVLKSGDTIRVTLWRDLSTTTVIGSDGKITLPLLSNVPADGLTTPELKQILEGRLTRYVKQPAVTVEVVR